MWRRGRHRAAAFGRKLGVADRLRCGLLGRVKSLSRRIVKSLSTHKTNTAQPIQPQLASEVAKSTLAGAC
ncbi:MAG: hypothetical protein EBU85_00475 [Actinobacteria bacterium]|nr:hypothetical protein [Actinomycetota bacterium]